MILSHWNKSWLLIKIALSWSLVNGLLPLRFLMNHWKVWSATLLTLLNPHHLLLVSPYLLTLTLWGMNYFRQRTKV